MKPEADPDRIAVPTNGHKPHPVAASLMPLRGEPPTAAPPPPSPSAASRSASGPTDQEFSVAFTPKQVAIGFGIVASLVLLLAGRARRGRSGR
jgi:hypothetical protein